MSLHFKKTKTKKLKKIHEFYGAEDAFDAYEAFKAYESLESEKSHQEQRGRKKVNNSHGKGTLAFNALIALIVCGMLFLVGFSLVDFLQARDADQAQPKQDAVSTEERYTYPISASIDRISVTVGANSVTEKAFTWYTPDYFEGSDVQVVELSPDEMAEDNKFNNAFTFSGESGAAVNSPQERWHKAVASRLTANQRYAFRVGDMSLNEWSAPGIFTTAPANGSAMVRFVCLTDTQAGNEGEAQLSADTMAKALQTAKNASFLIHSGDVTNDGSDEEQWSMILDNGRESLMATTIVPAAGNHERRNGNFAEHFNLPAPKDTDTSTGVYYSTDYGAVHLITLNTNDADESYACLSAAQAQWLRQDVAAAKDREAVWIVVNMHKGPYTLGPHATEDDVAGEKGSRNRIAPLLESLGVDLVLQGHDHFLSRTKPLSHGAPAEQGTTYLCLNSAGAKVYKRNSDFGPKYLERYAYLNDKTPVDGQYQNFAVITAGANTLSGIVYEIDRFGTNTEPVIVDHFMIERREK